MNIRLNNLLLLCLCIAAIPPSYAASLAWDDGEWNKVDWNVGGNSEYLDLDLDGLINKRDDDDDGDGIVDTNDTDNDNDGLSDADELVLGSDSRLVDTDADGIDDGVEVAYGLNPAFAGDANADNDNDGLSNAEEILLGTLIDNADSDNDGTPDGIEVANGSDPVDPNDRFGEAIALERFDDLDADGVNDWIGYGMVNTEFSVVWFNGATIQKVHSASISVMSDSVEPIFLNDRNHDGIRELGLFGYVSELSRYQLQILDGLTGGPIAVVNWPATLDTASFVLLPDLSGDGEPEYGIQGVHNVNGTRQLQVKNSVTKETISVFKWQNLWGNPQIVTMSDRTGDGIAEIALYGQHVRLGKGQLLPIDGSNSSSSLEVYNWNNLWTDMSILAMDDVDQDGTKDWGQFGKRLDDGRLQLVVKKGHDKRGVIRIFSWPGDLFNSEPLLVSDRTGDGVREVAVKGVSVDGKVFVRINDGAETNTRITNISWPANWVDFEVKELADLNHDGASEFALIGYTKNDRVTQLIVKDGASSLEYARYTWTGNWEDLSVESYDLDGDSSVEVIISGQSQQDGARHVQILTGLNLTEYAPMIKLSY